MELGRTFGRIISTGEESGDVGKADFQHLSQSVLQDIETSLRLSMFSLFLFVWRWWIVAVGVISLVLYLSQALGNISFWSSALNQLDSGVEMSSDLGLCLVLLFYTLRG